MLFSDMPLSWPILHTADHNSLIHALRDISDSYNSWAAIEDLPVSCRIFFRGIVRGAKEFVGAPTRIMFDLKALGTDVRYASPPPTGAIPGWELRKAYADGRPAAIMLASWIPPVFSQDETNSPLIC